jgi:hypothetical protein
MYMHMHDMPCSAWEGKQCQSNFRSQVEWLRGLFPATLGVFSVLTVETVETWGFFFSNLPRRPTAPQPHRAKPTHDHRGNKTRRCRENGCSSRGSEVIGRGAAEIGSRGHEIKSRALKVGGHGLKVEPRARQVGRHAGFQRGAARFEVG